MSTTAIISAAREMLIVTLMLLTPFLLTAVLSSFVMGLFQASTRINDLTLSFVPRFSAVLLAVYFAAPWATRLLIGYLERSAEAMRAILG
jgi:flagellar biosynthesis protein FliQ